jgi:hypothetical protein
MPSTLEQTVQKTSFFQRIKNSFTSRLTLLIAAGTFAFAGCGNSEEENCIPKAGTSCIEEVVYWVDSCENFESLKEHCGCGCDSDNTDCKTPCCGNDKIELPEECDNNNLGGRTCQSAGYDIGALNCTDECRLDISNCDYGPSLVDTKIVNGISISSGKTNPDGEIRFREGSKDIDIYVINENRQPVNDAQVIYFDGSDFECFQADHRSYTPHPLKCFAHNSEHTLSLTTSSLQALHHGNDGNEQSKSAATNYSNWAEANWEYLGCRDKAQIESMMDGGSYIIKLISKIFTLGFSDSYSDMAYDYLKGELSEDDAGHIYFFNPSEHGFYGTSAIWTIDFMKKEVENCNDNIDNDCDGKIDLEDGDCTCTDECDYPGQKECVASYRWKECGNYDSDNCLEWSSLNVCGNNQICEDGQCVPSCSDECSPSGYKTCVGNSWKECDDFDSDDCLEWSSLNVCGSNQTCEGGQCIDDIPVCADDSYEPNNSMGTASEIVSGTINNLKICPDNEDWFKIFVPANDYLTLQTNFTHADGNLYIRLYNSNGDLIDSARDSFNNGETVEGASTIDDYLYGNVYGRYSWTTNTYSMIVSVRDCLDECDFSNQSKCALENGWGYKICGNHDSDICLEWGNP